MPDDNAMKDFPIGVFDSGVGGITVLKALAERFPARSFFIWLIPPLALWREIAGND